MEVRISANTLILILNAAAADAKDVESGHHL